MAKARPRPWVCVLPRHLSQIRLVKSRNTRLRDTGSQSRSFCTYPSSLTRCQRRRRLPDCAARPLFFRQPCRNPSGPTIRRREGSHRTWRDGRGRAMGRGKESRTSRSCSVANVDDVVVDPSVGRSVGLSSHRWSVSATRPREGQASTGRLNRRPGALLSVLVAHSLTYVEGNRNEQDLPLPHSL